MNSSQINYLNTITRWNNFLTILGLNAITEIGRDTNQVRYVVSPLRIIYCMIIMVLAMMNVFYQSSYVLTVASGSLNILGVCLIVTGTFELVLLILTNMIECKKYAKHLYDVMKCEMQFPESEGDKMIARSGKFLACLLSVFLVSLIGDFICRRNETITNEVILETMTGYGYLSFNTIMVSHYGLAQLWLQRSFMKINKELVKYCSIGKMETFGEVKFLGQRLHFNKNVLIKVKASRKNIAGVQAESELNPAQKDPEKVFGMYPVIIRLYLRYMCIKESY